MSTKAKVKRYFKKLGKEIEEVIYGLKKEGFKVTKNCASKLLGVTIPSKELDFQALHSITSDVISVLGLSVV